METKLKKFLFDIIEHGSIVDFDRKHLDLKFGNHLVTVCWQRGNPEDTEFKYHNIHCNNCGTSGITCSTNYCSDVLLPSNYSQMCYKINIDDTLFYDIPMTSVEADKLTAILSEAFVEYQKTLLETTINDFSKWKDSRNNRFDDLLE